MANVHSFVSLTTACACQDAVNTLCAQCMPGVICICNHIPTVSVPHNHVYADTAFGSYDALVLVQIAIVSSATSAWGQVRLKPVMLSPCYYLPAS